MKVFIFSLLLGAVGALVFGLILAGSLRLVLEIARVEAPSVVAVFGAVGVFVGFISGLAAGLGDRA